MLLKAASLPISLHWPFSQAKETQGFVFHGSASSVQAPRSVLAPFLFPFSEELSSPGHPHLDSTSPWQPSSLLWSGFLDSTPCPPPPCDTPDLWCRQGKDWGLLQPLWLAVPSSQQELHVVLPKQPFTIFLKNILFIYLWPCPMACRILVLWPRIEPMAPLQLKQGVSTTEPVGKPQHFIIFNQDHQERHCQIRSTLCWLSARLCNLVTSWR